MLKEGGIFVVVEHTVHERDQDVHDSEWRSYMESKGLEPESIQEMFDRRNKVYFPLTEAQYRDVLEDAGFRDVRLFWSTCSDMGFTARKRLSHPADSVISTHAKIRSP